jgi:hypothetical protein
VADLRRARTDLATFAHAIERPLALWQTASLSLDVRTTVVVAPRQSGKSRSLAVVALWWAFRRPEQRVLVISAGEDASRRLLAEAAAVALRSPILSGSIVDENSGLLVLSNGSEIRSVPASERAVRGWSTDLLLVDECAQVDDELLRSAAIPTTAARPDARIVLASSPGPPEGAFYDYAQSATAGVHVVYWALADATWIAPEVIEQAREQLPTAAFEREYEGQFADVVAEERVIDREWIVQAQQRTLEPGRPLYGVDVARHGGDETVIVGVRGGVARVEWATRDADLMATAGRIAALSRDHRVAPPILLDAIGLGYGVLDRCRELGVPVSPFVASARAAHRERYLNLRAEAWWTAREAFRDGKVDLDPDDRVLAAQLGAVRYSLASNGSIQIADKGKMRTSPDRADALVIALYARSLLAQRDAIAALVDEARWEPEDVLLRDAALGTDVMSRKW